MRQNTYVKSAWDRIHETHYGWFDRPQFREMLGASMPEDVAFLGFGGRRGVIQESRDLGNNRRRIIAAVLSINPNIPRLILRNSQWQAAALEVFKGITESSEQKSDLDQRRGVRLNYPLRADVDNNNSIITNETMMIGIGSMLFVKSEGQWHAPMLKRDKGAPSFAGCWTPPGGLCTEALPITFDKELNEELALLLIDEKRSQYILPVMTMPGGLPTVNRDLQDEVLQRLKFRAHHWYGPSSAGAHKFNQDWPIVIQPVQLHQFPWTSLYEGSVQIKDETTGRTIASVSALGFFNRSGVVGLLKTGLLPPVVRGLDTTHLEPGVNCLPLDLERLPNLPEGREVGFLSADQLEKAAQLSMTHEPAKDGNVDGGLIDIATSMRLLLGEGFRKKISGLKL